MSSFKSNENIHKNEDGVRRDILRRFYGLVISRLYWLSWAVVSGSPVIDCSLLGSAATLIRPFNKAWSLHILLEGDNCFLCKCHNIRVQTEERCD